MNYAKDENGVLKYPTKAEFKGIPNYMANDTALRKKGYLPLRGMPEEREGFTSRPSAWHVVNQSIIRVEPRQRKVEDWEEDPETHERRKTGEHVEMVDTDVTVDTSYIQVDEWGYDEIPGQQEPDTSERDAAEKAIVGRIAMLARKYDALQDLTALDITIPNLLQLAASKSVTEEDLQAVKSDIAILVLDLMAKEGGDWQGCWEGLKSRFANWMLEILQEEGK